MNFKNITNIIANLTRNILCTICIVAGICACDDGVPENLEFEQFKKLSFSAATGETRRISLSVERDTSFVLGNITYNGTTNFGQGNIVAEVGADFSLVEAYNEEYDTSFEPLPEESFAFNMTKLVIENGKNYSGITSLFLVPSELEADKEYMLPVSIQSITGNIAVNDEKKTAYWVFIVHGEEGGGGGEIRPDPKDVYPLSFVTETATRITVTQLPDYVTLETTGNDPHITTTALGRTLSEGTRHIIAIEYKSNKAVTNAQFFYCVNGGAAGGVSSGQNIPIPQADDWTWFEFDLSDAMSKHGFGNSSHFLRFDPVADGAGYELHIRKIQVEVY